MLSEWATDPHKKLLFRPLKVGLRYGPVTTRCDDRSNDLILRFGDELEECLEVDWGPVFAEDQGRRDVVNSHLVRIYWVVFEAL